MAKTKISEYSATAANNTDVESVNIAEGCAPSGINNAIREVMSHLKDFQVGSAGDDLTVGGNFSVTGTVTIPDNAISGDKVEGGTINAITINTLSANPTLSAGTANGVTYLNGSKVLTSGSALTFDGSNLGLGVTPSAWGSGIKVLQFANDASLSTHTAGGNLFLNSNAYYNGTNWIYSNSNLASQYQQFIGKHIWYNAPSGTAGNAISFTQTMTLDASGNLGIGTSSPQDTLDITRASGTTAIRIASQGAGSLTWRLASQLVGVANAGFVIRDETNGVNRLAIDGAGNVGIGTNSPTAKLVVSGGGMAVQGNGYPTTGAGWEFYTDTTTGSWAQSFSRTSSAWLDANWNALTHKFSTSGAERVRIDSSGNVGIGTSSPSTYKDSQGTIFVTGSSPNWATIQSRGDGPSGAGNYVSYGGSYSTNPINGARIGLAASGGSGQQGQILFYTKNLDDNSTQPVERVRIDTNGNVGIGTISPTNKLHVVGTAKIEGSTLDLNDAGTFTISQNTTASALILRTATSSYLRFDTNGANERMRIESSGNVGIGTSSTNYKMSVNGTGNFYSGVSGLGRMFLGDPSDTAGYVGLYRSGLGPANSTTAGNGLNFASIDGYTFNTGAVAFGAQTERMRIDSTGDVMIGTTTVTADARLTVVQGNTSLRVVHFENTRNISGDENLRLVLGSNCNNTSSVSLIVTTNGDKLYIYGNGNVVNTNNSYGALSDIKLKENVVDATPKLADLMQVKVRNYNLIGDTTKQIGVVAQELEAVFPGMIDESPDRDSESNDLGTTTKSVKYSVFVPMLIKAMQEQQAIIESLTARVSALEGN
jgi:hypothetical protein